MPQFSKLARFRSCRVATDKRPVFAAKVRLGSLRGKLTECDKETIMASNGFIVATPGQQQLKKIIIPTAYFKY